MSRRLGAWLPSMIVLIVLSAGCAGAPSSSAPSTEDAPIGRPAEFGAESAGIQGLVVDDALQPIEGAAVVLVQQGVVTSSAADGTFSFSFLQPGSVAVAATKEEYEGAVQTVTLVAGELTTIQLMLKASGSSKPWHQIVQVQGYICLQGWALTSFSLSAACPNEGLAFVPFSAHANLSTLVVEMTWQRSSAMTASELQVAIWQGGSRSGTLTCEFCYGDKKGASPLYLRIEEGSGTAFAGVNKPEASPGSSVRLDNYISTRQSANTTGGVNIAYQQRVHILDSLFYHERAPPGFSALADQ